jgi:hypothetical protein
MAIKVGPFDKNRDSLIRVHLETAADRLVVRPDGICAVENTTLDVWAGTCGHEGELMDELLKDVLVSTNSGENFTFVFDRARHGSEYPNVLSAIFELTDHDTEIAVGLAVPDLICGKRHACRVRCVPSERRQAQVGCCLGIAEWLVENRPKQPFGSVRGALLGEGRTPENMAPQEPEPKESGASSFVPLVDWSDPNCPLSRSVDEATQSVYIESRQPTPERVAELIATDPSLTPVRIRSGVAAMLEYDGDDAGEVAAVWKAMSTTESPALATLAKSLASACHRAQDYATKLQRMSEELTYLRQCLAERDAAVFRATGKKP